MGGSQGGTLMIACSVLVIYFHVSNVVNCKVLVLYNE